MPRSPGFFRRPAMGLALLLTAFAAWAAADWYVTAPDDALKTARYVGRETCAQCHQAETALWTGSHHDRAMEIATDESVLGDFNDAEFTRHDERTRFFRDGKKFMVNAEGPDGEYHDYEVKYTFGVHPLQQYMVEFPDGRIQVLRVSWDVDKKEWFYVAPMDVPDERIKAGDPFHWTGFTQNWNTMCAECHVTDYHKNYDFASDTYKSQYNEIDVSCETCHGPGSVHVDLAQGRSMFWDRRIRYGLTNTLKGASNEKQAATCAPCHSRRSMVHPDYSAGDAYLDHFEPSLLHSGLYHPDGQIQDEVFEHGSFTQSRMFREGVKCTDCHDPHSLELKFEGNRLCAQCHQPGKYDGPAHHHHPNAAPGAPETQCVTCHMPTTTYMGIDHRRDHSIRVPRPDLTVKLGTPNVCNRCHTKPAEDAKWAADAVVKWYGDKRPDDPNYAEAIHAARQGDAAGEGLIRRMLRRKETPEYVRATMIELLAAYPTEESLRLRREALTDDSPLVRAAAVRSLAGVLVALNRQIDELREAAAFNPAAQSQTSQLTASLTEFVKELEPLLSDPIRTVRFATANLLADGLPPRSAVRDSSTFKDAIAEYRTGQSAHLDRAETHRNLGSLALNLDDPAAAVESFRTAIRQQPYRTDFRTELSQLLAKIAADPAQAEVWKKIGGTEEEITRLREEEVGLLERDSKLLPGNAGPHFHRGRLLFLLQRPDEAGDAFAEATRLAPNNYEYWMWLALIRERQQRWDEAIEAVNKMAALQPDAGEWKGLYQRIEQSRRAADTPGPSRDDATPATDAAPPATDASPTEVLPAADPPITPGQKQLNPEGK